MNFFCNSCEKDLDTVELKMVQTDNKELKRYCRNCCSPRGAVPDIFWDGKPEENLADDPRTGKPRVFSSKGEKAAYLKERGLVEAGDRVHGAPVQFSGNPGHKIDPQESRHQVKMALKHVKEMGRDVRRQEYLKILKRREIYG